MAARRTRPVLYEVYRPRQRAAEIQAGRASAASPTGSDTAQQGPGAGRRVADGAGGAGQITVSRSAAVIAAAVVLVLLLVAFSAGRRYEAARHEQASAAQAGAETAGDSAPGEGGADAPPAGEQAAAGRASTPTEPAREQVRQPAQPAPQVTLLRGYDYIVVQHFGRKRQAATEVARYLRDHGIECALFGQSDIRVIVTQPFLTAQDDAAAAAAQRRAAERLMQRIRALGKQLVKDWAAQGKRGYTLEGCYLYRIK